MSEQVQEYVGYDAATEYLQSRGLSLAASTLHSYVSRGYLVPDEHRAQGQYNRPVFSKCTLDAYMETGRRGRGARTDRMHAGKGRACPICPALCEIDL